MKLHFKAFLLLIGKDSGEWAGKHWVERGGMELAKNAQDNNCTLGVLTTGILVPTFVKMTGFLGFYSKFCKHIKVQTSV